MIPYSSTGAKSFQWTFQMMQTWTSVGMGNRQEARDCSGFQFNGPCCKPNRPPDVHGPLDVLSPLAS